MFVPLTKLLFVTTKLTSPAAAASSACVVIRPHWALSVTPVVFDDACVTDDLLRVNPENIGAEGVPELVESAKICFVVDPLTLVLI
jgi:hypothetical protein